MNNQSVNDFANFDYKGFSEFLNSLSPLEFGAIGCLAGLLISVPLSSNEQNIVGNFLELVGQVILTVQAQDSSQGPNYVTQEALNAFEAKMDRKINYIISEIKNIKNQ